MTVSGVSLPALSAAALDRGAARLLADLALEDPDGVTIVADAHYPYHPSTGMVTNPAVVAALARTLTGPDTATTGTVALAGGGPTDPQRVGDLLGYDTLSADAEVRALEGDDDAAESGPLSVRAVPDLLVETPTVVVPSARVDHETGVAGALATLTRAAGGDPTRTDDVRTVNRLVDPVAAVADATYTFTGDPHRLATLFGGTAAAEVDGALAALLGVDTAGMPIADALEGDYEVRGVDVDALRADLPDGDPPAPDGPGALVRRGYRLYTAVSGDIYPPHFREGR